MHGHEVILRTGRIPDLEMAFEALREAGIPCIRQEEGMTGIKDGYFQPAMGPGSFFNLLVPTRLKHEAIDIISELPIEITLDPDFWHYGVNERSKRLWKIFAIVVLGVSALLLTLKILDYLR